MIPYIQIPVFHLGPIPIGSFGFFVLCGVLLGVWLSLWRAKRLGLDLVQLDSFTNWMLLGGFIGAHVLDMIFYYPEEVIKRPWALLFIWEDLSSFGGFIGAVTGILLWKHFKGKSQPILPFVEVILSVFPIAWIFGRAGCASVHDHPGIRTSATNWLAVAYPDGPRYDLGLLEMFFAIILSIVVSLLWNRKLPLGSYAALVSLTYAPVRLGLDFLRRSDTDARYAGFTPAQWACFLLFGFGLFMLYRVLGRYLSQKRVARSVL